MKTLFQRLIIDFQEAPTKQVTSRDYAIPLNSQKIISLIGVRRCGKTYLLYSFIEQLRQQVDPRNIVYINFEDDRLYPLTLKELDSLIEAYFELFPQKREEKIYLFLDEVQNIPEWERFVRRIYDTLDLQIFVTGSSSKLLSKEIATSLRGRTLTYEIFPFSFKEYLSHKKIEINFNSSKSLSFIKNAFTSYMKEGGFAETFGEETDIQKRILRDYLDLIVYRDVIDRHNLKNRAFFKHLIKYTLSNIGTLISYNKLYNEYKSQGYKISKDTIYHYMEYLEDAFALFTVPIFRNSVREEQRHPRKIYAIDAGFKTLFDSSISADHSKYYENIVFLHLRRQSNQIYYFKQNQEIDFYTNITHPQLINVSYDISRPETKRREIEGLREGMNYFKINQATLITHDKEETIKADGQKIHIKPLWKWLLEDLHEV
jgi:predicted AAA+ superfamily ATPase